MKKISKKALDRIFADLSPRISSGVIVKCVYEDGRELEESLSAELLSDLVCGKLASAKPYLRPIADMTDEERDVLAKKLMSVTVPEGSPLLDKVILQMKVLYEFLNARMFDFNGLIQSKIALKAKEGTYELPALETD